MEGSRSLAAQPPLKGLARYTHHIDKIRGWLAAPDPSTNLNKAQELRQPGTGQWLLDSRPTKEE
jgi:hypothetical protein